MTAGPSGYGLWLLVVLNSAVFILFAFSFFKPATARDWRTFGAFSAFIVALFVEMYGFPLTLYLLSGWLQTKYPELDILSHDAGHLWSTLWGGTGDPHFSALHIASYLFLGFGFYLLSSAWSVLYQAQRANALATTGPYARIRHPQYVAFVLILLGFLLQWPTLLTLAMFPVLLVMYGRLAVTEEARMRAQFGAAFERYAQRTPRFFPRPSQAWIAVVLSLPLLIAALGSQAQDNAPAAIRTSVQQGVTVKVTPKVVGADNPRWQFAVVLDSHSSELGDDLVNAATLVTADGREIKAAAWIGAAPGGHHREGLLEFAMTAPWTGPVELKLVRPGEPAPRAFRWQF